LLFLFYINYLPKIVPYNSKLTFADDTSLIFCNTNYLDFKTTINNEFSQLNKWFVDNLLLLNYEKTQCVHFTLKHTVLYEAPIGYNNNFFSNSTSTKFLGLIIENTLSWKVHIDHLLPKLCMA
jgi:hypothetical protein